MEMFFLLRSSGHWIPSNKAAVPAVVQVLPPCVQAGVFLSCNICSLWPNIREQTAQGFFFSSAAGHKTTEMLLPGLFLKQCHHAEVQDTVSSSTFTGLETLQKRLPCRKDYRTSSNCAKTCHMLPDQCWSLDPWPVTLPWCRARCQEPESEGRLSIFLLGVQDLDHF